LVVVAEQDSAVRIVSLITHLLSPPLRWLGCCIALTSTFYRPTFTSGVMPAEGLLVALHFQNCDGVGSHLDYFVIRLQYRGHAARSVPEGAVPEQLCGPALGTGLGFDCLDFGADCVRD